MRSDGKATAGTSAPLGLRLMALGGILFLHVPLLFILLYAFSSDEKTFQFPPPGLTLRWFAVAWLDRPDIWSALWLSVKVAAMATLLAIVLGTCAAAAVWRSKFFGRESLS